MSDHDAAKRAYTRCPVHDMPDCSPLLNGCSRPNDLAAAWDAAHEEHRRGSGLGNPPPSGADEDHTCVVTAVLVRLFEAFPKLELWVHDQQSMDFIDGARAHLAAAPPVPTPICRHGFFDTEPGHWCDEREDRRAAREARAWDRAVREVANVDPEAIHNPYRQEQP